MCQSKLPVSKYYCRFIACPNIDHSKPLKPFNAASSLSCIQDVQYLWDLLHFLRICKLQTGKHSNFRD